MDLQRKLAAILSADVRGYSRLMGDNEEATVRTITAYRQVMGALIRGHRGRAPLNQIAPFREGGFFWPVLEDRLI